MSLLHRKILASTLMVLILIGGWSTRPALGRSAPAPPQDVSVSAASDLAAVPVTVPLRGSVTLEGRKDHAGITILADGQPAATTDAEGRFEIAGLALGAHLVVAQMPGYLSAATGEIEMEAIPESGLVIRPIRLLAGDANNDGRVNVFDLGVASGGSAAADFNGDGQTNLLDLVLVTSNYGRFAPIKWTGIASSNSAAPPDQEPLTGDVDGDGVVGNSDLVIVATAYGSQPPSDARADVNKDGEVNLTDLLLVADHFGQTSDQASTSTTPVEQATPTPIPTATSMLPSCSVTSYALNVRSGPGTVYPVLTAVRQHTDLEIVAREARGYWIQVRTPDGTQGWVAAAYTACNVPVTEIGVAENIPPPAFTPTPVYRAAKRPKAAAAPGVIPPQSGLSFPGNGIQPALTAFPLPGVLTTPAAPVLPLYPVPALVSPLSGSSFERTVTLNWFWAGVLGPDEWFDVQVWRPGEVPRGVGWSKTTTWTGWLPGPRGTRLWRIVVIKGINGQWLANLSLPSEERFFDFKPERGSEGGGGAQPPPPPAATSTSESPQATATEGPPPPATDTPETPPTETPVPPPPTDTPETYPPEDTPEPTAYPPPSSQRPAARPMAARTLPDESGQFPLLLAVPAVGVIVAYGPLRRRRR